MALYPLKALVPLMAPQRHPRVAAKIVFRSDLLESSVGKQVLHGRFLIVTVFDEQPTTTNEILARFTDDDVQRIEAFDAGT